jgi:hypothetical protein
MWGTGVCSTCFGLECDEFPSDIILTSDKKTEIVAVMLQKFKELFKKNMTVNFNDTIQSTLKASMAASFELVFRRRDQLKEGMQKMDTAQLPQNKLTVCAFADSDAIRGALCCTHSLNHTPID